MRQLMPITALLLLAAGCGSDRSPSASGRTPQRPATSSGGGADAPPPVTPTEAAAGFVNDPQRYKGSQPADRIGIPPRVRRPDPAAVIGRYQQDCRGATSSAGCAELRAQVEVVFLDVLVALRSTGQPIDRAWYRVAAGAGIPQLASMGLRELLWMKDRSAAEDATITAALESPYRGPRNTVLMYAQNLPALKALMPRVAARRDSSDPALDGRRDSAPDSSIAGGYPGARYRYFASSDALHWYSTTDPPEKVIAFFARGGKKALSKAEFEQASQVRVQQAIMKAAESGDETKMMNVLRGMATETGSDYWTRPFERLEAAGEVRYVMLGPQSVISVFRDDALHETSIVAPRAPLPAEPATLDLQKAQEQAEFDQKMRQVYSR